MTWFVLSDDVLVQEVDDELVVLNLATEQYFALNATARALFEWCRQLGSAAEVVSRMVDAYAIDEATARADLENFLAGMVERRLAKLDSST
jgi:hypothetical protein